MLKDFILHTHTHTAPCCSDCGFYIQRRKKTLIKVLFLHLQKLQSLVRSGIMTYTSSPDSGGPACRKHK